MKQEDLEQEKRRYLAVPPPAQLDFAVRSAIRQGKRRPKRHNWAAAGFSTAAAFCLLFVTLLNTSQAFAQAVSQVPVLGQMAQVLTFRAYSMTDGTRDIQVRVPSISDTGNTELENRVNTEIRTKVDTAVKEANQRADELRQAFVETGGESEEFMPVIISIDYEIKSVTSDWLSFAVTHTEVQATSFMEETFYNINLKTGEDITLQDLLGEDYVEICNRSIRRQMEERQAACPSEELWFSPEMGGFQGIAATQRFYVNQDGYPVVSFEKYEVAPGYRGIQDFEIKPGD